MKYYWDKAFNFITGNYFIDVTHVGYILTDDDTKLMLYSYVETRNTVSEVTYTHVASVIDEFYFRSLLYTDAQVEILQLNTKTIVLYDDVCYIKRKEVCHER